MRRRIKEQLAATAEPFLEPGDLVLQAFRAGRLPRDAVTSAHPQARELVNTDSGGDPG